MDAIFKAVGIAMITVVLYLFLEKQNKDIAVLVALAACCAVVAFAGYFLDSILTFIRDLRVLGGLDGGFLEILIKSVGIGLISEIAALICADGGNSALGKTIHILAVAVILWTALPLLSELIELANQILGEI